MSEEEISHQETQHISKDSLEYMKRETWKLIRMYCKTEGSHGNYRLHLHDETLIKFSVSDSDEIDRFCGLVENIAEKINMLIRNLSYESDIQYPVSEYVTGSIDFEKTRILRQIENKKLVCIQYSKNLFTYENVLLSAVILGINNYGMKLIAKKAEWKVLQSQKEVYVQKLDGIISLTNFWLKDRNVSKLTNHYYQNYQGIEYLLEKTLYRLRIGKIAPKYHPLIQFIRFWKKYDQILNADDTGPEIPLTSLEHFRTDWETYEIWIFYKMLELFFKKAKSKPENSKRNPRVFTAGEYTITYQYSKKIGWKRVDGNELNRIPDTAIKKHGRPIALIDAKYRAGPDFIEREGEEEKLSTESPKTNIVNQMIIAMDYGDDKVTTNLGIVLFADKQDRDDVVIEKSQGPSKKIHFLNMHPENSPLDTLDKVGEIIGLKRMPNS